MSIENMRRSCQPSPKKCNRVYTHISEHRQHILNPKYSTDDYSKRTNEFTDRNISYITAANDSTVPGLLLCKSTDRSIASALT